jgi:hypothetical protein
LVGYVPNTLYKNGFGHLIMFSSEPWRVGAGGCAARGVQARVPQVLEAVHQLRTGAVPWETARLVALTLSDVGCLHITALLLLTYFIENH